MTSAPEPKPDLHYALKNVPLGALNTLSIAAVARNYYKLSSDTEIRHFAQWQCGKKLQSLVLGDGSNVVLQSSMIEHCVHIKTSGIEIVSETSEHVRLAIAAGENWNSLVNYCLSQGYFGLENLALIPGSVGAAPIQNIGAYGVELNQFVESVRFYDLKDGQEREFDTRECQFAYRDSVFKHELKDRAIISSVHLLLSKRSQPNISYKALATALEPNNKPSAQAVRDAVVAIRTAKLPDPSKLPNAGSFFKNPLVSEPQLRDLQSRFPNIVSYPTSLEGVHKLAAAWLLEQAGWKGYSEGGVGFHADQALVLVNIGQVAGEKVLQLAHSAALDIEKKFGVKLAIEPQVY